MSGDCDLCGSYDHVETDCDAGGTDKTIWKFTLAPGFGVPMPIGAEVLHAAGQGADVCVWALVDPTAPEERRYFDVYGTGHPMPAEPGRYVGTVHLPGPLVFHVFDRRLTP